MLIAWGTLIIQLILQLPPSPSVSTLLYSCIYLCECLWVKYYTTTAVFSFFKVWWLWGSIWSVVSSGSSGKSQRLSPLTSLFWGFYFSAFNRELLAASSANFLCIMLKIEVKGSDRRVLMRICLTRCRRVHAWIVFHLFAALLGLNMFAVVVWLYLHISGKMYFSSFHVTKATKWLILNHLKDFKLCFVFCFESKICQKFCTCV